MGVTYGYSNWVWNTNGNYIYNNKTGDTTKRVGIGTDSPEGMLHVLITSPLANTFNEIVSSSVNGAAMAFRKARGTLAAREPALLNDISGGLVAQCYTDNSYNSGAAVRFYADEDQGATANGMRIVFQTKANSIGKAGGPSDSLTITSDGVLILHKMPTSSVGLPTGAVWSDSGTLKIV